MEQPLEAAPQPEVKPTPTLPAEPVAMVPRTTLNYVIIGVVFFALGLMIGVIGYDRLAQQNEDENRALINQTVAAVVSQLGATAANDETAGPSLNPAQRYTIDTAGNPALGPADAPITIIEFGDFHCGFCKRFNDSTLAPLRDRYGDQVQIVFRDYPILGQQSLDAALAAECADDQGKFWEFHDLLYADQTTLTRDGFIGRAETLGMDVATFTTCYDTQQHRDEIAADYQAGAALGVGGTPTFFINGRPLIGAQPIDAFVNAIDSELAVVGASS